MNEQRIAVTCPACRRSSRVRAQLAGKRVRCPDKDCGSVFQVPTATDAESADSDDGSTAPSKKKSPNGAVPPKLPPSNAKGPEGGGTRAVKRKRTVDGGLNQNQFLGYGAAFLLVPFVNVLVSSILYYRWRSRYPKSAEQINRMGFSIFAFHMAVGFFWRRFDDARESRSLLQPQVSVASQLTDQPSSRSGSPPTKSDSVGAKKTNAPVNLLAARRGFQTRLVPNSYKSDGPADPPPPNTFRLVRYPASPGDLAAYITPDPGDNKRHPAVLWAHGGFGGIGSFFWEEAAASNDQSARAFREAGIVLMCPSWRGENDNPGKFELFFGEVDDMLAARDYLAAQPFVDPERIYIAGHSTGGTLTLLAAVSTDKFRAAFSFGGAPDMESVVASGGYGNTPFDTSNPKESRLRSAIHFVDAIQKPTFYFEGSGSSYTLFAAMMQIAAKPKGRPFQAYYVASGDHFSILAPLTKLIAKKINGDTGETCNVEISPKEVENAMGSR